MLQSRLKNGVRIVTLPTQGHFVSAGVFIKGASRNDLKPGTSAFMERMALKSTQNYNSEQLVEQVHNLGSNFVTQHNRECFMYQASVFRDDLPKLMEIYNQIVLHPLIKEEEIESEKENTKFEIYMNQFNHEQFLPELLHQAAFRSSDSFEYGQTNTLGRPSKSKESLLNSLSRQDLIDFRKKFYTPDRIVIAGVGVDHQQLMDLSQEFASIPVSEPFLNEKPAYRGGVYIVDTAKEEKDPNPDNMQLTHLQIAYEAMGITDPDIYSLATLGQLLGGGGSFSAGGPGKGMYTRLYTQVLNRNGWIENCNVINHSYSDVGLFGITCSVPTDEATHHHVPHVVCDQIVHCTQQCTQVELDRAKNQLKSSLLMSLESQLVQLEDMGRQVLHNNKRLDVVEVCKRIDMVTCADLIRVARRVFLAEDKQSRFEFEDSKHWKSSTNGVPTVLVHGPLVGPKDSLWNVQKTMKKWGLYPGTNGFFSKL
jgi:processing peptidase subunit alpha